MANKQLAWDYVEFSTVWEAEYAVQFPVLVPSVLGTENIQKISVIGKRLVQLDYPNGINYRTSNEKEDISGDYNQYPDETDFKVNGYTGVAKGAFGRIFVATWSNEDYSYSISVPHGITMDNLKELIKSLKQVNSDGQVAQSAVANPMIEYDYLFEAEYAVGFGVPVPTVLETGKLKHIFVIAGKAVELDYKNDIVYRVAQGSGDISGVYKEYPYVETFTEGSFEVTAKGDKDLYYVSLWTGFGMTWSLYCPHGIHMQSLIELIHSLNLVDSSVEKQAKDCCEKIVVGSYGRYHAVTEEEKAVFQSAMKNIVGVDYEPLAVATQVVAGTNYRFICNATVLNSQGTNYLALVTIFQPLPTQKPNTPVVTDIKRLSDN